MTTAKLFILGEERELLWINTNYHRYTAPNGSPTSDVDGGFLTLSFVAQESDDVFWHNMTKEVEKETERMEKGEVHFYKKGDEDIPIRKYKFSDAYLIEYSEVFDAYGTENMHIVLTISPAIQNYGNGKELIKHWQISKVPTKPVYYIPKQEKKETRVKTIQLITALDFGSANDNSGTNQQEGMLYGKSYEFKVVAFTEETPADKSIINWAFKYHSLSEDKWIEKKLSVTGDTLKFTLNEKDMCGRFVYIRAYIKDAENEGELKVWKHNRYRFFDRMVVHEQIKNRINDPWKIDQGQSSLCGMAALYYAMAKKDSNAYEKLAKELFRTGEYRINSYILKPHEKSLSMYDVKPSDVAYRTMRMPEIDWIVLATTRSKESLNSHLVYNGFENSNIDMLKGVNWPEMLTRMCKEVGGFASAESHGLSFNAINNKKRPISGRVHDYFSHSDLEELQAIDKAHKWGRTILMMIDADMIYNKSSYNSLVDIGNDSHWVVYEGRLQLFDAAGIVTKNLDKVKHIKFKIYTWGEDIQNSRLIKLKTTKGQGLSVESFKSNYYGYIEAN